MAMTSVLQTMREETVHTEANRPALQKEVAERMPVVRMPGANRLEMHEVVLPDAA